MFHLVGLETGLYVAYGYSDVSEKGNDSESLRRFLQAHGVEPVIKRREYGPLDYAHNLLEAEIYH